MFIEIKVFTTSLQLQVCKTWYSKRLACNSKTRKTLLNVIVECFQSRSNYTSTLKSTFTVQNADWEKENPTSIFSQLQNTGLGMQTLTEWWRRKPEIITALIRVPSASSGVAKADKPHDAIQWLNLFLYRTYGTYDGLSFFSPISAKWCCSNTLKSLSW